MLFWMDGDQIPASAFNVFLLPLISMLTLLKKNKHFFLMTTQDVLFLL